MHSDICIGASHLGTLDVQRVDVKHVMTEPNHKTELDGRILKSEDQLEQSKTRLKARRAQGLDSTNTDSVLSQTSPGA